MCAEEVAGQNGAEELVHPAGGLSDEPSREWIGAEASTELIGVEEHRESSRGPVPVF